MDDHPTQLSEYGSILLIGVVGILLVCVTMFMSKLLAPNKPNPIKLSTYECGEETTGSSWVQFNPRFYVIALVFLLFDVELIFVFPWATVFGQAELIAADSRWGWFTLIEMGIFLGILILGLVYVWVRGDLDWVRPKHTIPSVDTGIPLRAYEALNKKQYHIKDYKSVDVSTVITEKVEVQPKVSLGFKLRIKKPNA
ncbi:NADH-quinone oxidoreductase subunit A [Sphingobacterium bovistauri]|uniref:NADH-quinone oxidoreductase subunit A n=1 Tax=Sphingobacterium bovistauri TaxID=2781959 RepID=A0ABS7Z2Y3_9SPHI|nr:NADH-quinone oxidoreductase subunit A [Sphingobacterium bovistauri]MCA5004522.1 NADH-quinone oxidoreductase subunit A [Sphingobacterium bovistauri]